MKYFLAAWHSEGLESLADITQYAKWEQQNLLSILKEEKQRPNPVNQIVFFMTMRARFNPQRNYEVYAFSSDISEEDIEEMFKDYPQSIVNLIREKGVKVFSDVASKRERVIK